MVATMTAKMAGGIAIDRRAEARRPSVRSAFRVAAPLMRIVRPPARRGPRPFDAVIRAMPAISTATVTAWAANSP